MSRLSAEQTAALVSEAESVGDTVVLVEIDPREGSGVIPLEWEVLLQPKEGRDSNRAVAGTNAPALRKVKSLAGTEQRDYDYDVFWVVFPLLSDSKPVFGESDLTAELVVRINDKEGHAEWPIPESIREKARALLRNQAVQTAQ